MGADTLPTLSASQDPLPYGDASRPVRQDPTQYIIAVHWGDEDTDRGPLIGSWQGQFDSFGYYFADGGYWRLALEALSTTLVWGQELVQIPGPSLWTASMSAIISATQFPFIPSLGDPPPVPFANKSEVTIGLRDGVTGAELLMSSVAVVNASIPVQPQDVLQDRASGNNGLTPNPASNLVAPFVRATGGGFYGVNFIGSDLTINVFGLP